MAVAKMLTQDGTRPTDQDTELFQRSVTVRQMSPAVTGQESQPEPHNDWGSAGVTQTPWNWLELTTAICPGLSSCPWPWASIPPRWSPSGSPERSFSMVVSAVRLFTQQLASPGIRVDVPGVSGLNPQLAQLGPPYSLVRMAHKACSESRGGKQGHSLHLLLGEVSAIGTCICGHLCEPKRPHCTVVKGLLLLFCKVVSGCL